MSELTRCNHCNLRNMRQRALDRAAAVIVEQVPEGEEMAGWYSARYTDADKPSAYFMALTDGCVC